MHKMASSSDLKKIERLYILLFIMNQHVVLMSLLNTSGNRKMRKQDTRAGARAGALGGAPAGP